MDKAAVATGIYLVGLIALCVALGMTAGSVWVGLLVFAGAIALQLAFNQATDKGSQSAIWVGWIGVGAIYWAGQMAQYSGGWMWSIPWALSALLLLGAAAGTARTANLVSFGMVTLGGLSAVMAVLGPLALVGLDQAATQQLMVQWWWVWVLLVGLITLWQAASEAKDDEPAVYLVLVVIGIGILAVGSWFGRDANPWVVAAAWMAGAVLAGYGAWAIRDEKPAAGWTMLLVSVAGLVAAIAVPILLPGRGASPAPAAVGPLDPVAWLSTAASATWDMVRSGWGVLYLGVALVLGTIWSRRFGGIVALLGLLGVIGATAGGGGGGAAAVLSDAPASVLRQLLATSAEQLGSPGWGALLLGAGFALVVLPSVRRSVALQMEAGKPGGVTGLFGASTGFGTRGQNLDGPAAVLLLVHPATLLLLVASLWLGLQGLAAVNPTTSFLGVPDVTVPSFAPVWDVSYFLVALAVGAVTVANQRVYRRIGLRQAGQTGESIGWLVGSLLLGLVVPSGVLLFLLSHNLVVGATTALVGSRMKARSASRRQAEAAAELFRQLILEGGRPQVPEPPNPKPTIPRPPRPPVRDPGPKLPGPKRLPGPKKLPQPPVATTTPDPGTTVLVGGDLLYRSPEPLIDLLQVVGGDHFLLRKDGHIDRWHQGRIEEVPGVVLEQPVGLAPGKDGAVIAADGARRLVSLRLSNGSRPEISEHPVELTIGCFAVNPFGTIAAYAPVRRPDVLAMVLSTGLQQVLAEDVGAVTAMAFSANSRHLALGLRDGPVRILDMAMRRVVMELAPPTADAGRVVSVAQCPDGGWVAAYQGGLLARWDEAGMLMASRDEGHRLSSVAVCGGSGRVAVGSADGHVLVHPAGLDRVELDTHASTDEIVRVAFEPGRETLVSAGRAGAVRRAMT